MAKASLELCLVMPAYNEQECIAVVVTSWLAQLRKVLGVNAAFKMVVVNDGSKDETGKILDTLAAREHELVIVHQANAGHGAALRHGYETALQLAPTYVFQVDSDNQFMAKDFNILWARRFDPQGLILGYRQKRHDALHRLLITRILRLVNFSLFGCYVVDANIPFRLFKGSYLQALLKLLPNTLFAPNIFLALLAAKDSNLAKPMPVTHLERQTGVVSILRWRLLKVCMRSFRELVAFRINLNTYLHELKAAKSQAPLDQYKISA